jgi:predicted Co/Zn/Cd cation transporter (cation efflux family)
MSSHLARISAAAWFMASLLTAPALLHLCGWIIMHLSTGKYHEHLNVEGSELVWLMTVMVLLKAPLKSYIKRLEAELEVE